MPYVACPGCGTATYAVRLYVLRSDCLVCGTKLLSPGVAAKRSAGKYARRRRDERRQRPGW
jgi:ribosomal protein S27E